MVDLLDDMAFCPKAKSECFRPSAGNKLKNESAKGTTTINDRENHCFKMLKLYIGAMQDFSGRNT